MESKAFDDDEDLVNVLLRQWSKGVGTSTSSISGCGAAAVIIEAVTPAAMTPAGG
jgi:hypothetical protein